MLNPILATSLLIGIDTLRANPLRTILSTLGIVIGVASLVSVLSIGDGMEQLARDQIGTTTSLQQIGISPRLTRLVDGTPFPVANPPRFTLADAAALRAAVGDSATVNMVVTGAALVTTRSDTTTHAATVLGLLVPEDPLTDSSMSSGRPFTVAEGAAGSPVVVLSYSLAEALAGRGAAARLVDDSVRVQGKLRRVVGVLKAIENDRLLRALTPIGATEGAMITGPLDRPASLTVRASTVEAVVTSRSRIEGWAARAYGATWKERVNVVSDDARLAQVKRGLLLFKLFMGALMSISLIVGGIGIMNVLLSSVIERTREIGIRKAVGAAQRHILWQFLWESVTITGFGSMLGLALGVGAAFGATALMRRLTHAEVQASLSASTVFIALTASVVVGLTFGLYPAMRAARLSPIDAIHND